MIDRRKSSTRDHIDEAVSYLVRAAVLAMCGWTVYTTNNTSAMIQVLEWRMMNVELAVLRAHQ